MKKKGGLPLFFCILLLIIIISAYEIWISYNWIEVKTYEVTDPKVKEDVRVVVISDLHDREFGKGNEKLIEKVEKQSPDLILMDGDFLNDISENSHIPCQVVKGLSAIAPVYYALGNQEIAYMERHPELYQELETAGAVILEKTYVDLDLHGTKIRLGGMYDYAFGLDGNDSASAVPDEVREYLEKFQDTDRLKIMMSHRPDSFILGDASSHWDVDLVVSGHNHGGQMVLPFIGGVYGGDQGWFLEYSRGLYEKDGMKIFITSGLGSGQEILPRFNNRPEIAVLTIKN